MRRRAAPVWWWWTWWSPACVDGSPARYRTAVLRLSAGRSAFELRERIGARSRTRTWECRCVRPMPWPLGEASAARRVGVAATRKQEWCTREDLNLHAASCRRRASGAMAAAPEAAASAVSPRVRWQRRIDGAATADRTPVSALPKRCPATGRLRRWVHEVGLMEWCWLEDSNLPPLAYEASALPDELSQPFANGQKRDAAPLPVWKRPCRCAGLGAASKSGRSQCQRARRHRRRRHRRTASCCERAQRCACAVGT